MRACVFVFDIWQSLALRDGSRVLVSQSSAVGSSEPGFVFCAVDGCTL